MLYVIDIVIVITVLIMQLCRLSFHFLLKKNDEMRHRLKKVVLIGITIAQKEGKVFQKYCNL